MICTKNNKKAKQNFNMFIPLRVIVLLCFYREQNICSLKVLQIERMLGKTATTMKCTFRNELSFFEVCRNLYSDIFRGWHSFFVPLYVFSHI